MHSNDETPGLKRRRNRDGTFRLYWVARSDLTKKGYEPKSVRLHYDDTDPSHSALISSACKRLQAEMLQWAGGYRRNPSRFDGTVGGLIKRYQLDPESPYNGVKWNTRRTYTERLDKIERAIGSRALSAIGLSDFRRWYDAAKKPKAEGEEERITKAHNFMRMIRQMLSYGIAAELPECERLHKILDETRFKAAPRRRERLELSHVVSFIEKARERGRLSLALGTAVQFETGMRQKDVIGEWEPIPKGTAPHGIVLGNKRWVNGLTWTDINSGLVFSKATTKTGAMVSHDLNYYPLTLALLDEVPAEKRVGPLIVDETAGRPYADHAYAREWRQIAKLAGIPDSIRNMDARAGAITEAEDAGADLDEIRSAVGHTQASTTARYLRGALGKARSVAEKRAASRTAKERK
ncbi:integrase [Aestuariivirga sp.]|uniref:integrase n=1 Tax=Aestuariivirga sp. TaxID=2650926 RepID=UPI0035AF8404